jgi:hypothetical protein
VDTQSGFCFLLGNADRKIFVFLCFCFLPFFSSFSSFSSSLLLSLSHSRSGANTVTTDISFNGKPSKRGLRSEEAIMVEVVALRLKSKTLTNHDRQDRVRVSYQFLERRPHATEEMNMHRTIDFEYAKTFPIEKERDEAFDVLSKLLKNSGGRSSSTRSSRSSSRSKEGDSSLIEFRVELMRRNGDVDRVLGTATVDLLDILDTGSDRDYTPFKDLKVLSKDRVSSSGSGSIGELQVSVRAFACLDRVINSRSSRRDSRRDGDVDRDSSHTRSSYDRDRDRSRSRSRDDRDFDRDRDRDREKDRDRDRGSRSSYDRDRKRY